LSEVLKVLKAYRDLPQPSVLYYKALLIQIPVVGSPAPKMDVRLQNILEIVH
jgi:hypothetical protein